MRIWYFLDHSLHKFPNFEELDQVGSKDKVSDGFEDFVENKKKFSTTTEGFDLEVIKPGRPELEVDQDDDLRNSSSIFDHQESKFKNKWPLDQIIKNDRFNKWSMENEKDKRLNGSSIFNDRLGEVNDDESFENKFSPNFEDLFQNERPSIFEQPYKPFDDVIEPGRPSTFEQPYTPSDDVIEPGRPNHLHHQMTDHYGNKVTLGLGDLISNGRPPTILLGSSDDNDEEAEPELEPDHQGNKHHHDNNHHDQHHDHQHHHHDQHHDHHLENHHNKHHHHQGYGSENEQEVPIENGRPDVEEDLHLSNEEEEGDDPHPEESDYDDDSSENQDFHSYHTLHLLNNNQSDKPSKNESDSKHEKTEGTKKPKLPSYYPQLASHFDDTEDSELSRLRPNFTQTLQSTIIAKYPHYGQHHQTSTKNPPLKPTTKKPATTSTTSTTTGNSKRPIQITQTPAGMIRKKHQQMVQDSKSKVKNPNPIDRFSADILDPKPNLSKLFSNKTTSSNKTNSSNVKLPVSFNQGGSVVSIDEWKSILIEKLTNAISKVAASQGVDQTTSSQMKLPGKNNFKS